MTNKMVLLFSYGTLQNQDVQLKTFDRVLEGEKDQLPGYKLDMVEICDCNVVELSGKTHHPVAIRTGNENDKVSGVVFKITTQELMQSDCYEVNAYKRVKRVMESGKKAWVYVDNDE